MTFNIHPPQSIAISHATLFRGDNKVDSNFHILQYHGKKDFFQHIIKTDFQRPDFHISYCTEISQNRAPFHGKYQAFLFITKLELIII